MSLDRGRDDGAGAGGRDGASGDGPNGGWEGASSAGRDRGRGTASGGGRDRERGQEGALEGGREEGREEAPDDVRDGVRVEDGRGGVRAEVVRDGVQVEVVRDGVEIGREGALGVEGRKGVRVEVGRSGLAGLRRYVPLRLRPYLRPVRVDLSATYTRKLHKWLVIAPLVGVLTGLTITGVAVVILREMWPAVLGFYLGHHWAIVPGLVLGCVGTGLVMQFLTPDPNEHSTEEVIRSYHEHEGAMELRSFPAKLLAAVLTVGFGGSAALEGPSIYGGAAIGVWVWGQMRRFGRFRLDARERRILLICGAAAGMSAVFRAPLTGIVFALEMPYKDDLAHEALLPSLIASVVSYMTLGAFLGSEPLFHFGGARGFGMRDLLWSAVLGVGVGLLAMVFVISFRRLRGWVVRWGAPHWVKLGVGGLLTGLCGLLFLQLYPGTLVPLGPNYEAVNGILNQGHSTAELLTFGGLKLLATAATLGAGGVSAMFVPLFLTGGAVGLAFAQSVVHSGTPELYAAVGMSAFIAAAYKTPLAAVVFVAEAAGGHAFLIPALVGSAVAYAVSGDASASGDQRVSEEAREEAREAEVEGLMRG